MGTIPLKRFGGKGNVDHWLKQLEVACEVNGIEESKWARVAVTHLEGDAMDWYCNSGVSKEDFTKFATQLRERFNPHDSEGRAWKEIDKLEQGRNESVSSYRTRLQGLASRVKMSEEEMQRCFIRGLRVELRRWVKFMVPHSYTKAVEWALRAELSEEPADELRLERESKKDPVDDLTRKMTHPKIYKVDKVDEKDKESTNITCYNCGGREHRKSQCPSKPNNSNLKKEVHRMEEQMSEQTGKDDHLEVLNMKRLLGKETNNEPKRLKTSFTAEDAAECKRQRRKRKALSEIPLMKDIDKYSVVHDLTRTKADITHAQLLYHSPDLREELKKALVRERTQKNKEKSPEPSRRKPEVIIPVRSVDKTLERSPRVIARIDGFPIEVILDGGSTANVISAETVEECGLPVDLNTQMTLVMADGRHVKTSKTATAQLQIGELSFNIQGYVLDGLDYDILLGRTWLKAHNTVTNWSTGEFRIQHDGEEFVLPLCTEEDIYQLKEYKRTMVEEDISESETEETYRVDVRKEIDMEIISEKKELIAKKVQDSELTDKEAEKLLEVLEQKKHLLAVSEKELTVSEVTPHTIDTGEAKPIMSRPYQIPRAHQDFLRNKIASLLELDLIKESSGPWSFPVVLVKKKDGSLRMCVDYRKLNAVTTRDAWPMPIIDDLLQELGGARFFTTLDLYAGYWQIKVAPEDQEKTTFTTNMGNFKFSVMPFGLVNAPATFQRAMSKVLAAYLHKFVIVYLDDVTIYSQDEKIHLEHINLVLNTLETVQLKINLAKCHFAKRRVEFLGHVISEGGVQTDAKKIEVITKYPTPTTITEVRGFLGMTSYYRKFIKNFAEIAEPLHCLLRKEKIYVWNAEAEIAFCRLKTALSQSPVLDYPRWNKEFLVYCDASNVAIGVAVHQKDEREVERPIAFGSRRLTKAEQNYSTTEKEFLAIIFGLKKFRYMLLGQEVIIRSDHRPLRELIQAKEPTGRLARWILLLQEYAPKIEYVKGKENVVADALSRVEVFSIQEQGILGQVYAYLNEGKLPMTRKERIRVFRLARKLKLEKGKLYKQTKTGWVPVIIGDDPLKRKILERMHDQAGHVRARGLFEALKDLVYWPGMYQDATKYVEQCVNCQKHEKAVKKQTGFVIPVSHLFERFGIDFVGPLPRSSKKNEYLLVAVEYLTRWPIAKATRKADAEAVVKFLIELVEMYGIPKEILTDNGTHFKNKKVKDLCEALGIAHKFTTAYHPQSNGLTERMNQSLIGKIKRMIQGQPKEWDRHLATALFAIRTQVNRTTGYTPFELMYGIKAKVTNLVPRIEQVSDTLEEMREKARERISKNNLREFEKYEVDDLVLLQGGTLAKLEPPCIGPYRILKAYQNNTYEIEGITGRVNGDRLRLFQERAKSREEECGADSSPLI